MSRVGHLLTLIAIAAALGCRSAGRDSEELAQNAASAIPPGWIATPPYDPKPVDGECVNFTQVAWSVSLSPNSGSLEIMRIRGRESPELDTITVPGGRLIGFDRGEFGGDVWFVNANTADSTHVHSGNLVAFARIGSSVLGLAGRAHLGLDTGYVLRFVPTASGYSAIHVLDLGEAPHAPTSLGGDSLLVVSGSTLRVVRVPTMNRVVHRSTAWPYTYPSSVVRDRAGVIYVAMRRAVARLMPTEFGFSEDWLVPAECPRLVPAQVPDECPCIPPPR